MLRCKPGLRIRCPRIAGWVLPEIFDLPEDSVLLATSDRSATSSLSAASDRSEASEKRGDSRKASDSLPGLARQETTGPCSPKRRQTLLQLSVIESSPPQRLGQRLGQKKLRTAPGPSAGSRAVAVDRRPSRPADRADSRSCSSLLGSTRSA